MSRRSSGRVGRRLPLFKIIVEVGSKGNNKHPEPFVVFDDKGKVVRMVDRQPKPVLRTLMEHFKDGKAANKFGRRFGTIISCRKVDPSPYLVNVEYLNLEQKPITIPIDSEEFEISKELEVKRHRKRSDGKKYDVGSVSFWNKREDDV